MSVEKKPEYKSPGKGWNRLIVNIFRHTAGPAAGIALVAAVMSLPSYL